MFKAILLGGMCSVFLLQASGKLIGAKEIFSEQEATLPSDVQDTNTSKRKKNKSSQSVPKPKADENGASPSLLNPSAEKEIFPDQ